VKRKHISITHNQVLLVISLMVVCAGTASMMVIKSEFDEMHRTLQGLSGGIGLDATASGIDSHKT
jgi:hypothetical protein